MYRTHNCGELTLANQRKKVTLSGWVQKARNLGGDDIYRYKRQVWGYSVSF